MGLISLSVLIGGLSTVVSMLAAAVALFDGIRKK